MLKDHVLYSILDELKTTLRTDCSVWDLEGHVLAATCDKPEEAGGEVEMYLLDAGQWNILITDDHAIFPIRENEELSAVFVIHGKVDNVETIGRLCTMQFETASRMEERKMDKKHFFQQLFLDNLLLVDVYSQARKLRIPTEAKREIFVIEPKRPKDSLALETIKTLYAGDYVTSVSEGQIILVKSLKPKEDYPEVEETAKMIVDMLDTEAMVDVRVAFGNIVTQLKDLSKCYKEACIALDVGRVFYADRRILAYNELGIGRLIHQLPVSLCEMFLAEVFRGNSLEQLDEETLLTVSAFFENSLNVSETARKIYLHRNTLGYRLDKIMRTTGLDVKKFDDAMTFKIALMVSEHLKFIRSQE